MRAVVSFGSNLEPKADYIRRAINRLANFPDTRLISQSRLRTTEPVDVPAMFDSLKFLNANAVFETELDARDFSKRMHEVEDAMGRVRVLQNGPRTIDIDLIAFGDVVMKDPELTLPHPRAVERSFVMDPMREIWIEELRGKYSSYVDTFQDGNGKLPSMMYLKFKHTAKVLRNAELIAEKEGFTEEETFASVAAALLHDTGRYEQLKQYNTFKDSDSVDHAVFSHDIVKKSGWLDDLSGQSVLHAVPCDAILKAVLYHNRRDLPEGMDHLTEVASHTVRDADKLDIFRVLEDQVANSDWRHDSRAFWNLEVGVPPNPEAVRKIRERRPVDYQDIKSLADFVLIQVGWMISGLHFETSRRLCRERGHLEYRRKFLQEIGGGPEADALCDLVEL